MINLGNIELSKMYLGSTEVQKAYLGTEQIYPSTQPTVVPIQIVQNGNFADGLNDWTVDTYCTAATQSVGIKLTKKKSTTRGAILYQSPSGLSKNSKYYQKVVMKKGSDTACAGFCTSSFTVSSNVQMFSDVTADWDTLDQITSPTGSANKICLRVGSSSSATGVNAYFKSFMVIDLTAMYGAGNEPSLSECRTLFPNDYYPYNVQ